MFDNDMLSALATQRGLTMDGLLSHLARVQASRDAEPDVKYVNGRLYQDGIPATEDQVKTYDATNPYVAANWMATPEDRGGRMPGAMPSMTSEGGENTTMDRQNEMLSKQTDFFGRPLGPVVRTDKLPAKGIKVEQTSVEAIPAGKVSVPYNAAAGVKPLLNSILGGVSSRTATKRGLGK